MLRTMVVSDDVDLAETSMLLQEVTATVYDAAAVGEDLAVADEYLQTKEMIKRCSEEKKQQIEVIVQGALVLNWAPRPAARGRRRAGGTHRVA